MNSKSTVVAAVICGVLISALTACRPATRGDWTPVLKRTSTAFLRSKIDDVAQRTSAARSAIATEPEQAAAELEAAELLLEDLSSYYLPLLEAREGVHNAYRHYYLREMNQTIAELERVEDLLMELAGYRGGRLLKEIEEPLERLEDARAALAADSEEASKELAALAARLESLIVKGGLVLSE